MRFNNFKMFIICVYYRATQAVFDQHISYEGQMFSQVEGAAMGSPVSPIVTNIFMHWFEETSLDTFPYEITLWKQYVDDTIVLLMDELLEDFTAQINAIHLAIRFNQKGGRSEGNSSAGCQDYTVGR